MSTKKKRVTLEDVAKHAGVSRATASLIARNSPKVSEKTRQKVQDSIQELGYVYDRVAANLRSQTTNTVGIIITDVANTFYAELLLGVHQELETRGYTVLLGTTFDSSANQEHLISTMLEHRVDGIILCPASESGKDTIEQIESLDIPVVLAVRELLTDNCDYVGINYKKGAQLATDYLIQKGHKRISFIGGYPEASTWKERMAGFTNSHEEAGLEIDNTLIFGTPPTRQGGMKAALEVIHHPKPPSAIFCFSDLIAFGVIIGLRNKGWQPGKDIEIIGFDNVPETEITYPPLTTVASFPRMIGQRAAEQLYNRLTMELHETQKIILNPELVVR